MVRRLSALLLVLGCAAGGGPETQEPPLLFVRARGAWAPEELHRDVAECLDIAYPTVRDDPRQLGAPPGTARAALREGVVACMTERGWATGSSVQPEEWVQ